MIITPLFPLLLSRFQSVKDRSLSFHDFHDMYKNDLMVSILCIISANSLMHKLFISFKVEKK